MIKESFLLRWGFWAGSSLDHLVRYRFELKSPVPVTADIMVEGDKFCYEEAPQGTVGVTFHCHTHIFALLMYGRMQDSGAMAAGLAVEGDTELAEQFSQWFKGI